MNITVPEDLKKRVRAKVVETVDIVQQAYPSKVFKDIGIQYERSYTTAGWAICDLWLVNFDPILLVDNEEEFISQIVPHEVAHILAEAIFGEDIAPHGPEWKSLMIILGLEPHRCHDLDTSKSKRKTTTYEFKCNCKEDFLHYYYSRTAKLILNEVEDFICEDCDGLLVYTGTLPKGLPKKVAGGTKMDKARWIMKKYKSLDRRDIIKKLMDKAGLSKAGANTYFSILVD